MLKGCVKKSIIYRQSQFTTRKRYLLTNFLFRLNGYIYSWFLSSKKCFICSFSKRFWRSAIYLFENVCCQPFRMDVIINMYQFYVLVSFLNILCFVDSKRQARWYSCFPTDSPVKNVFRHLNPFVIQIYGRIGLQRDFLIFGLLSNELR